MVTADDIKQVLLDNYVVYVKYVRVGDEYRFALDADWSTPNHSQMIKKGEKPTSAGNFKLYSPKYGMGRFEWENHWSTTLNIGSAPDDEANLIFITPVVPLEV